jgi:hypothetical protein
MAEGATLINDAGDFAIPGNRVRIDVVGPSRKISTDIIGYTSRKV